MKVIKRLLAASISFATLLTSVNLSAFIVHSANVLLDEIRTVAVKKFSRTYCKTGIAS